MPLLAVLPGTLLNARGVATDTIGQFGWRDTQARVSLCDRTCLVIMATIAGVFCVTTWVTDLAGTLYLPSMFEWESMPFQISG